MARRGKSRAAVPPAADARPAEPAPATPAADPDGAPGAVLIRAGHTHRGITYDGRTRYSATPAEVALLRRFNAIVED